MFQTFKNAWKVPEIKNKLLFTLLIVILYRIGANIPVPYVDEGVFKEASEMMAGTILQYLNIIYQSKYVALCFCTGHSFKLFTK